MSALSVADRQSLEKYLCMSSGFVLNFSDRSFGQLVSDTVDLNIHGDKYASDGTSNAKKLNNFWQIESDAVVGTLLLALIEFDTLATPDAEPAVQGLIEKCRQIAVRLLTVVVSLGRIKKFVESLNAVHLAGQIRRIETSNDTDPSLAICTTKELVETRCKTIHFERGMPLVVLPILQITKSVLKELKLVPEGISDAARGADVIKRKHPANTSLTQSPKAFNPAAVQFATDGTQRCGSNSSIRLIGCVGSRANTFFK